MQITKEYLEEQIASLKKQKEQLLANANAAEGALQAREQDLAYLNTPEQPVNEAG